MRHDLLRGHPYIHTHQSYNRENLAPSTVLKSCSQQGKRTKQHKISQIRLLHQLFGHSRAQTAITQFSKMKSAAQERCCIVPLVIRSIPATSHLDPLSLFLQRRERIYSCLRGQFHSFVPFTALIARGHKNLQS